MHSRETSTSTSTFPKRSTTSNELPSSIRILLPTRPTDLTFIDRRRRGTKPHPRHWNCAWLWIVILGGVTTNSCLPFVQEKKQGTSHERFPRGSRISKHQMFVVVSQHPTAGQRQIHHSTPQAWTSSTRVPATTPQWCLYSGFSDHSQRLW